MRQTLRYRLNSQQQQHPANGAESCGGELVSDSTVSQSGLVSRWFRFVRSFPFALPQLNVMDGAGRWLDGWSYIRIRGGIFSSFALSLQPFLLPPCFPPGGFPLFFFDVLRRDRGQRGEKKADDRIF